MRVRAKPPAPWAALLSDVNVGWPWPYSKSEAAAIADAVPDESSRATLEVVIEEARLFLSPPAVAERAINVKPNSTIQVLRLSRAVQEVKDAIEALDLNAQKHLEEAAALNEERPFTYLRATYAFE